MTAGGRRILVHTATSDASVPTKSSQSKDLAAHTLTRLVLFHLSGGGEAVGLGISVVIVAIAHGVEVACDIDS